MNIDVYRDNQLIGSFAEDSIVQGLQSGRLRETDEYFFEGMEAKRSLHDFINLAAKKPASEPFIRVHRDKKRARRESKRNDAILLSVFAAIVIGAFGILVYKDVSEKKERRAQAERERMIQHFPDGFSRLRQQGESATQADEDQVSGLGPIATEKLKEQEKSVFWKRKGGNTSDGVPN